MKARYLLLPALIYGSLPAMSMAADCNTDSCGLGGPRGAMDDDSRVVDRPLAPTLKPTLPKQGERILPKENLILWGTADGAFQEKSIDKIRTVVLKGKVPLVRFESGRSNIDERFVESLRAVLKRLSGKRNLRLRVIGNTDPQHLSARSKKIYGDNYGLGMARAKIVGQLFIKRLGLDPKKVTYASNGPDKPLTSNDTPEGMAINRRVEVQVWYDEVDHQVVRHSQLVCPSGTVPAPAKRPPFRISVDGKPVEERDAPNSADEQRCEDVALAKAKIQVQYDNLGLAPRLNVGAGPRQARIGRPLKFQGYSNYLHWIDRAEVRIYGKVGIWTEPKTLAVVPLDKNLGGQWTPSAKMPETVYYRLRVYDKAGRYDETQPQPLSVLRDDSPAQPQAVAADLAAVYGGNRLARHTIPVEGGTITVNGKQVPADRHVLVMGHPVPLDAKGAFVTQQLIPEGLHTIEVSVLDKAGHGTVYHRDLRLPEGDWFYVGLADVTVGQNHTTGPARLVTGDTQHFNDKTYVDGRFAFYAKGKVKGKYSVTTSADTREGPFGDLFTNFNSKDPRQFLRRLDSNRSWAVYGDDSTLVEDAPTQGKFFAKIDDGKSHALWGNFKESLGGNELAQIDRSLYGAQLHYSGNAFTADGERRFQAEGFAAEPGTASAREDFNGTGGSLYFLHHQDITSGSEQVRVEVRDKVSGRVLKSNPLVVGEDYNIDPIQGRIMLNQPLPSVADDSTLVHAGSLSGNPVYLVVNYEYSPGFTSLSDLASGGRVDYWLTDALKVGVTGSRVKSLGNTQDLSGLDLTLRKSERTWIKFAGARTDGAGLNEQVSSDGGFGFNSRSPGGGKADAGRMEAAFSDGDLFGGGDGHGTLYLEHREAGFSAPGKLTTNDTRLGGGSYATSLGEGTEGKLTYDQAIQAHGTEHRAGELDIAHHLDAHWTLAGGVRTDDQKNTGTTVKGRRNDAVVRAEYASGSDWTAYGFAQGTVQRDPSRDKNGRVGIGGRTRVAERTHMNGEISGGDLGTGAKAGIDYAVSNRTHVYLNYLLNPDRADSALGSRTNQVVTGARSRWNDQVSVYGEERYQRGDQTGLTQAYGVDYAPDDRWNYGMSLEHGRMESAASGTIKRTAVATRVGYRKAGRRYGGSLEYRRDESRLETLKVWLMRNNYSEQVDPNWRAIARLDFAVGDSSRGDTYNGNFVESSLGYAYRPVDNDRLNALLTYSYLSDLPPPGQVSTATGTTVDYAQRSHVAAVDAMYDLTRRWSVGGKYAYRVGELRPSRDSSAPWFSSTGQLFVLRADWHVVHKWDLLVEGRRRDEFTANDSRVGALFGIYRHVGQHMKIGIGYNFADFSDNMTDFTYRSQGVFINAIGKI